MPISTKKETKKEETKIDYQVKVTKAIDCKNGSILVDLDVNGVSIYSCFYKVVKDKQGKDIAVIDFPQHKSGDKWYKYAYFFISPEMMDDIETQIEAIRNSNN